MTDTELDVCVASLPEQDTASNAGGNPDTERDPSLGLRIVGMHASRAGGSAGGNVAGSLVVDGQPHDPSC